MKIITVIILLLLSMTVFSQSKQDTTYKARLNKVENLLMDYGDGKGLDACNIFARVIDSDKQKLIDLGNSIWKNGSQDLTISEINKTK